jgi:RNA polymerase sigma-70 factor (ECF subfamily)
MGVSSFPSHSPQECAGNRLSSQETFPASNLFPRAILLLSDVLDWHASEIANLLSISVSAVKSALHRARVRLSKRYHVDEQKRGEGLSADAATQALLERYLHAWDTQDVAGLVALMKEDATFTMPPSPSWYQGREAIRTQIATHALAPELQNRWFFLPTGANGGPACAVYRATGSSGPARAFGIQVLTLEFSASGVLIADVTTFLDPSLFPSFGRTPATFPYTRMTSRSYGKRKKSSRSIFASTAVKKFLQVRPWLVPDRS